MRRRGEETAVRGPRRAAAQDPALPTPRSRAAVPRAVRKQISAVRATQPVVLCHGRPSHVCKMVLKAPMSHDDTERDMARIQSTRVLNWPLPAATATPGSQERQWPQAKAHGTPWARHSPQTTRSLLLISPGHVLATRSLWPAARSADSWPPINSSSR